MILKNPTNGAPIEKFPAGGKLWSIAVGESVEFEDSIGQAILDVYGFLEKVEGIAELSISEENGVYKCSACDYSNKTKVAVIAHQRGHGKKIENVGKAVPLGDARRNKTISELREIAHSQGSNLDIIPNGRDKDGVEWFGEGLVESKPGNMNIGGTPGHFGAAS